MGKRKSEKNRLFERRIHTREIVRKTEILDNIEGNKIIQIKVDPNKKCNCRDELCLGRVDRS